MNSSRHTSLQSGFSMVEVLVTLIILLVGLLGLAGLMVQSQRSEMESYQRVQALVLLQDMAGRLNANRLAAQSCYSFTVAGAGAPYLGEGSALASPATPAPATAITDATCTQANIIANAKAQLNITTLNHAPLGSQADLEAHKTYDAAVTSATNAAPAAISTALTDLRDWHNALLGAAETQGGANAGAMVNARGCISYDDKQESPQLQDNGLPTGTSIPGTGIYTVSVAWQGKGDTFAPTLTCGKGSPYTSEMSRRVVSLTFRIASLR